MDSSWVFVSSRLSANHLGNKGYSVSVGTCHIKCLWWNGNHTETEGNLRTTSMKTETLWYREWPCGTEMSLELNAVSPGQWILTWAEEAKKEPRQTACPTMLISSLKTPSRPFKTKPEGYLARQLQICSIKCSRKCQWWPMVFGELTALGRRSTCPFRPAWSWGRGWTPGCWQVCCGWKKGLGGDRCSVPELCSRVSPWTALCRGIFH